MSVYTQKRTCERCKALDTTARSYENSCQLGFNNRGPSGAFGLQQTIPQEPCPKPMTINAFYQELKIKQERIAR